MAPAQWTDKAVRQQAINVFRSSGVREGVYVLTPVSDDEIIFVLTTDAAAIVPEASATRALIEILGRKVWITTEGANWGGELQPLI